MKPTSPSDPIRRNSREHNKPLLRSHTPHSERGRHEERLRHAPHGAIDEPQKVAPVDESEENSAARLKQARHRRARQKVRAKAWAFVLPTAAFSLILMAMTSVVLGDQRRFQQEVRAGEAQLSALQAQLDVGERRADALQAPKGREQLLVEHGYLKPGERILLFPATKEAATPLAKNDLVPRRAIISGQDGASPWRRATQTITGWVEQWSGGKKQ